MLPALRQARLALELTILDDAEPPWRGTHRMTYRPLLAAAAGVPSLVEAFPGLERTFTPPDEIATFSDPRSIVDTVDALLADPERLRAVGAQARRRLLHEHTWEHRARRVLADAGALL